MFCTFTVLHSQYRFTNYDYTHGLPVNNISKIAEDSLGYLWLGSPNGLVQFDGMNFNLFESNGADSTTIYGSEIADIEVSPDGRVWVSFHEGGISVYNHANQKFRSRNRTVEDGEDFPKYAIVNFCIDTELNNLWMLSKEEGVFVLNMETFESKRVITETGLKDIIIDPLDADILYIAGRSLMKIDKHTLRSENISDRSLTRVIKEGNNIYGYDWANNIFTFDCSKKIEKIYPKDSSFINKAIMVHQNEIWLGIYDGILVRDLDSEGGTIIKVDSDNPFSIANNHISALFKDKNERIWIGTERGLSVIDPENQKLVDFEAAGNERFYDIISGKRKNEYYLNSFYDNLIKVINLETEKTSQIKLGSKHQISHPSKMIRTGNKIWVHFFKGFGYFTDENKNIKKFDGGVFDSVFQSQGAGDMVLDDQNNIWWFKPSKNILFKISTAESSVIDTVHFSKLNNRGVIKVLQWDGKAIWLGTEIGICRYDPNSKIKKWIHNEDNSISFLTSRIEDLGNDHEGNLWVLSLEKGAWKCKYNEKTETLNVIKGYGQLDGLPNNRPWTIEFDSKGNIYFGSVSGLAIYNPENDRMLSYDKRYGFSSLMLSPKVIDDKLFILKTGLSYFNIDDLHKSISPPKVYIQSLSHSNDVIFYDEAQNISFNYKENDIAINYLALELTESRDLHYRYRIRKDDPWSEVDFSQRKAIFNELPSGIYTFEVAAARKDMIWGPSTSISFEIHPPFWKTWWFISFALLLISVLVYTLFQNRLKQVKHLSGMQTRMAELENEALRSQMNPHFIFNSLNSIKSFIISNRKEEAADYLTVFSDLIRNVLINSKKRFISLEDEIEALNLYMEIENIRLENKFSVVWNIDKDVDQSTIVIPPLSIQPFVENAIWHGFVHKEEKGNLHISINKYTDTIRITIKDDGIGRVKSKEIEKRHPRKRSFGIDITEKRLDFGKGESEVTIKDLYDDAQNPTGTEVILKMPFKHIDSLEKTHN